MKFASLLAATLSGVSLAARKYDVDTAIKSTYYSAVAYADIDHIKSWSNFTNPDCVSALEGFQITNTFSNPKY